MGGSRYLKLRLILLCFILAILVPIQPLAPWSSVYLPIAGQKEAEGTCETNVLYLNEYNSGQFHYVSESNGSQSHVPCGMLWTKMDQSQILRIPSSDYEFHTLPLKYWIKIAILRRKVNDFLQIYDVIFVYAFYIYCYGQLTRDKVVNMKPNEDDTEAKSLTMTSFLLSLFTSKGHKKISHVLSDKYNQISKYGKFWSQTVMSCFPVFPPASWPRMASYSKLAFDKLTEHVSFMQLSEAGFQYTGDNHQVVCVDCNNLLNILDFKSSPADDKYHAEGCKFVQTETHIQTDDSDQWSPSSDTVLTLLSKAKHPEGGCGLTQVEVIHELQANSHSQELLSSATSVMESKCVEMMGISDIPGVADTEPAEGVRTHTTTNNPSSSFRESVPNTGHCLDSVENGSRLSHTRTRKPDPEQQLVNGQLTECSCHKVVTQSQFVSGVTLNQTNHSTAAEAREATATAAATTVTTTAATTASTTAATTTESTATATTTESTATQPQSMSSLAAARSGAGGSSGHSSDSQPELVHMAEFQPEAYISSKEVQKNTQKFADTCSKNRGHYSYYPVGDFKLEYIPSNVRQPDVHKFFKLVATLTVRVVVSAPGRKRLWSVGHQTETKFSFGTGFAVSEPIAMYGIPQPEDDGKPRKHFNHARKNKYIFIETSRHLVSDNSKAENATVEFFYDKPSRQDIVVVKGVAVYHSPILGDIKSILVCKTSDVTLMKKVRDCRENIERMARDFPHNLKEKLMTRIYLLSHPHGMEKVFAFGEYMMVKYCLEKTGSDGEANMKLVKISNHAQITQKPDDIRKMLLYTVDTCPGSTGGVIVSFMQSGAAGSGIVLDLWMHNGYDVKQRLNMSALRAVTADDIMNHGHQTIFRPVIQDDIAAEAERAANQVVTSPMFIVSKPPAYPAYATYRKRLESFPVTFTHVHKREDLADAGFFNARYADCVRCFQCGLGLRSWKPGDIIHKEHFKNRPDCRFLLLKLREAGIEVSTLEAQLIHGAETQAVSEMGHSKNHLPQETGETEKMKSVMENLQHSANNKTIISEIINDTSRVQPPAQELTVCHAAQSDVQARDAILNSTMAILEKEQRYLKQIFLCKICCTNQAKDLFLPCGELVACLDCSKLFTHCPSCNKKILATVTTYFS